MTAPGTAPRPRWKLKPRGNAAGVAPPCWQNCSAQPRTCTTLGAEEEEEGCDGKALGGRGGAATG